jgi:hypothetical protein
MPAVNLSCSVPVVKTARVLQLEGLFDVSPSERSERTWSVNLPLSDQPWQIGLVVGPSGSGKSTLAREAYATFNVAFWKVTAFFVACVIRRGTVCGGESAGGRPCRFPNGTSSRL